MIAKLVKAAAVLSSVLVAPAFADQASRDAYSKCKGEAFEQWVLHLTMTNIPGLIRDVDRQEACNSFLKREDVSEVNKVRAINALLDRQASHGQFHR